MFKKIFSNFNKNWIFLGTTYYLYNELNFKTFNFYNLSIKEIFNNNKNFLYHIKDNENIEIISNGLLFKDNIVFGYVLPHNFEQFKNKLNRQITIEESFNNNKIKGVLKYFDENSGFYLIKIKSKYSNKMIFNKNEIGEEIILLGKDEKNENIIKKSIITEVNINNEKLPYLIDKINESFENNFIFIPTFSENGLFKGILNPSMNFIIDSMHIKNLIHRYEKFNNIEKPKLGLTLSSNNNGLNVMRISQESIFNKENIDIGDIITKINDKPIKTIEELKNIIGYSLNNEFNFKILKNNLNEVEINITI